MKKKEGCKKKNLNRLDQIVEPGLEEKKTMLVKEFHEAFKNKERIAEIKLWDAMIGED